MKYKIHAPLRILCIGTDNLALMCHEKSVLFFSYSRVLIKYVFFINVIFVCIFLEPDKNNSLTFLRWRSKFIR
jgi:hypothetical protein